jgi:D-3-phosphoglycerate dehydrogenase
VNIASMQVGRRRQGGEALMALTVDSVIPPGVLDRVMTEVGAHDGTFLNLGRPGRDEPGQAPGAGA